ncbi:MAG: prephenate dehydratase [Kiritimatiellae bacterium]|nr:prephenate dehydratase [Kiritimatiellia bacterium]
MTNLDELRKRIDALDDQLIQLLNNRTKIALDIGMLKEKSSSATYVPAREKTVFERIKKLNEGPLKNESLQAIYREVMSASLSLERNLKIAYLGPSATFTHQAALSRFGRSVDYAPCETTSDVFLSVEQGSTEYGVVPIENSTEGAVTHTLDEFVGRSVAICAEIFLPISHHLLSRSPQKDLQKIYSNPQVFGQCRRWLLDHASGIQLIPISSTAKAAETVVDEKGAAALASSLAAELYGLDVLEKELQDIGGNTTRFLVIAENYGAPTGQDKTSIVFGVKHQAGALYQAIGCFAKNHLNLIKIESRPNKTKAWEYHFFVDFEGHAEEENVQKSLEELLGYCTTLTVLGSYPAVEC